MIDNRLITFITLTRLKNYTKTAEKLHMTQPAVSQHIKYLEKYYSITLFQRKGRELIITKEGKDLLEYAKKMLSVSSAVEKNLREKRGSYHIGATLTIGGYFIPEILFRYLEARRSIGVSMEIGNTENVLKNLREGGIDLAVVEGVFDKKKYKNRLLIRDSLILVVSPENSLAKRRTVDIEEVLKERLILREEGSGTRKRFEAEAYLRGIDIKESVYMEIGSLNAIKKMVEMNAGVSVISREAVKREIGDGSLAEVEISGFDLEREFNFVWTADSYNKDFIEDFMEFCSGYISG